MTGFQKFIKYAAIAFGIYLSITIVLALLGIANGLVKGSKQSVAEIVENMDEDDLKNIDGIGDSIAQSIITHRAEHGSFYRLEDVMDVNGIGNATFSKLKNYIRLKEAN